MPETELLSIVAPVKLPSVVGYPPVETESPIILIVLDVIMFSIAAQFALFIEQKAGYYQCPNADTNIYQNTML